MKVIRDDFHRPCPVIQCNAVHGRWKSSRSRRASLSNCADVESDARPGAPSRSVLPGRGEIAGLLQLATTTMKAGPTSRHLQLSVCTALSTSERMTLPHLSRSRSLLVPSGFSDGQQRLWLVAVVWTRFDAPAPSPLVRTGGPAVARLGHARSLWLSATRTHQKRPLHQLWSVPTLPSAELQGGVGARSLTQEMPCVHDCGESRLGAHAWLILDFGGCLLLNASSVSGWEETLALFSLALFTFCVVSVRGHTEALWFFLLFGAMCGLGLLG